ncbi:MAG: hypothetical protein HKN25_15645 [Pyrinomonadaceae bacterium]|nr:hypothetical protein [Pyrinomonadaceae bacterium]
MRLKTLLFISLLMVPSGISAQETRPFPEDAKARIAAASVKTDDSETDKKMSAEELKRHRARVVAIARSLKFLNPNIAAQFIPERLTNPAEIRRILEKAIRNDRSLITAPNFCDPDFVGAPISFTQTSTLVLDDLLYQIHRRFNVNFLVGEGISGKPINIRTGSIPWNTLLTSQLFLSGVRATCIDDNTIQLVANTNLPELQDAAEVNTKFIKLKFLQPATSGNKDIAGRSNTQGAGQGCQGAGGQSGGGGGQSGGAGNCGNFEKLIIEIEKILGIRSPTASSIGGGGQGGGGQTGGNTKNTEAVRTNRSVSVIPGRNILVVRATDDELDLINQIIEKADRPPFQVIIRGLVYTANETMLRDIGVQTNLTARTADGRTTGDFSGNPVPNVGTLFDFSTLIGTVDFNIQASALQSNGAISIKSRPFAMVVDGDTADLDVGRQIPVLIQAQNSLVGNAGTLEILEAGNILSVTPQVIDDENGKPIGVNLTLQLESNDVDLSVVSQGVPSVNRRSIQTRLLLNQETTAILGGFTVDTSSRDTSKTPGLGSIPILGYLFKRKIKRKELNRLYFAISLSVVPYGDIVKPILDPEPSTDIPKVPKAVKKIEKGDNNN